MDFQWIRLRALAGRYRGEQRPGVIPLGPVEVARYLRLPLETLQAAIESLSHAGMRSQRDDGSLLLLRYAEETEEDDNA